MFILSLVELASTCSDKYSSIKTYLSYWGWGPATQKSSGRFMCEWKTPETEEEEPSHPSLHANRRARSTDVSSPSSCAAKASNSFSGVTTWCLITRKSTGGGLLLQLPERPPSPWRISSSNGAAWAPLIFLFAEDGLVTSEETRGSAAARRGATQWHPDNSVRMSAPYSGPNLIFRPRSLIHTHYDNDWQDL